MKMAIHASSCSMSVSHRPSSLEAMAPLSEFPSRVTSVNDVVNLPTSCGMVPLSELCDVWSDVNDVRRPSSEGMAPMSEFLDRSRYLRLVRRPS